MQKPPEPYCCPVSPSRQPVPNKAVAKPALWSRFLGPGSCFGRWGAAPRGTALAQLRLPACQLQGFSSRALPQVTEKLVFDDTCSRRARCCSALQELETSVRRKKVKQ